MMTVPDYRQQILSPYVRQVATGQIPKGIGMSIGPNDAATFISGGHRFIAKYTLPLLPTSGAMTGSAGETLRFDLPATVQPMWDVRVYDYDQDMLDHFIDWQAARTVLRLWSWGLFIGLGTLSSIPINRPETGEVVLTFALTGMRIYTSASSAQGAGHEILLPDGTTYVQLLNWPFAYDVTSRAYIGLHTYLYGSEVL